MLLALSIYYSVDGSLAAAMVSAAEHNDWVDERHVGGIAAKNLDRGGIYLQTKEVDDLPIPAPESIQSHPRRSTNAKPKKRKTR